MAIVAAVLLVHAFAIERIGQHMVDWRAAADMPPRIEVVYVREMALEAPPVVQPVPAAAKRPRARRVAAPAAAASAAAPVERAPEPEPAATQEPAASPEQAASAPDEMPTQESVDATTVAEPALDATLPAMAHATSAPGAPASAPAAPGFAWPRSTRLSYVLTGNYRGELHGTAQVEWIKVDERYQVHLDAVVGLPFAPLFTRRMSSEGVLGDDGLAPERFDQDSKMALRERQRDTLRFAADAVWLAHGQRHLAGPGVQDTASQFVQLAYLFNTQPSLREPGSQIAFPLALPRQVLPWVYETGVGEPLYTSFGEIETLHVRPMRTAPRGNLSAEVWVAPALRYLPVRIRLRQDESTFIELVISRKPELAAE